MFVHWGGANNINNNMPSGIKTYGDIDPRVDAYKLLEKVGWVNGRYGSDMNGATNTGYPALLLMIEEWILQRSIKKLVLQIRFMKKQQREVMITKILMEIVGMKNLFLGNLWMTNHRLQLQQILTFHSGKVWLDYDVNWKYDSANNKYLRSNGGNEHKDLENGEQLTAKNVVIVFVKEEGPVDKEHHMLYTVTGKGEAVVFKTVV